MIDINDENIKEDALICFFIENEGIYIGSYYFDKLLGMHRGEQYSPEKNNVLDVECIKTVVNSDKSKALVCLYSTTGLLKSFLFDLYKKEMYDLNHYFDNKFCKSTFFSLNVYYFESKNEFINSCLDENGNILVEYYGGDFNIYNYEIIETKKRIIYGYSILYSNCTKELFLVSGENSFKLLNGDDEEFEKIKKDFRIEDCLNYKSESDESEVSKEEESEVSKEEESEVSKEEESEKSKEEESEKPKEEESEKPKEEESEKPNEESEDSKESGEKPEKKKDLKILKMAQYLLF